MNWELVIIAAAFFVSGIVAVYSYLQGRKSNELQKVSDLEEMNENIEHDIDEFRPKVQERFGRQSQKVEGADQFPFKDSDIDRLLDKLLSAQETDPREVLKELREQEKFINEQIEKAKESARRSSEILASLKTKKGREAFLKDPNLRMKEIFEKRTKKFQEVEKKIQQQQQSLKKIEEQRKQFLEALEQAKQSDNPIEALEERFANFLTDEKEPQRDISKAKADIKAEVLYRKTAKGMQAHKFRIYNNGAGSAENVSVYIDDKPVTECDFILADQSGFELIAAGSDIELPMAASLDSPSNWKTVVLWDDKTGTNNKFETILTK